MRAIALLILSLFLLPFDTCILISTFVLQLLVPQNQFRRRIRHNSTFQAKTILVTGINTVSGLALARLFYQAGHTVIAADHQPDGILIPGRFSKAVRRFHPLPPPDQESTGVYYARDLLNIIGKERVNLWISCSDFVSAAKESEINELVEKTSGCRGIRLDSKTTTSLLCDDVSFLQYTNSLGLPNPQMYHVTSRDAVHKFLGCADTSEKFHITKRARARNLPPGRKDPDLLPRRSVSQTYQHVSQLPISDKEPFTLQQHVEGEKYQTRALVIRGFVEAFAAYPGSGISTYLEPLPATSGLCKSMLRFIQEFVRRGHVDWTGHLSIAFLVEDRPGEKGLEQLLWPVECTTSMGTFGILLQEAGGAMVERYLKACGPIEANGHTEPPTTVLGPDGQHKYYWIGYDLVTLVVHPIMSVIKQEMNILQCLSTCGTFLEHLLFWKEATYAIWDPLPWWWQYHVSWPLRILVSLIHGTRWSKIEVKL